MSQHLLESRDGAVATLTMNRPDSRNALSREMMLGLLSALRRLATDPEVRAVVLTGAGKAFCAGGDVKGFARAAGGEASNETFDQRVNELRERMDVTRLLHEMPKPTLAVIPGACAGAGLSLALACDMRIAATDAKLTTAFGRIGLSGDFGGSYFLTHLLGPAKARELYFTSRVLTGQEAADMGMVNQALAPADLPQAALSLARELAALPTIAIGYMKKNLNLSMRGSLSDVLDSEAIHMLSSFNTADHRGAAQAFVDKRAPVFNGR